MIEYNKSANDWQQQCQRFYRMLIKLPEKENFCFEEEFFNRKLIYW